MSDQEVKINVTPKDGVLIIENWSGKSLDPKPLNKIDIKGDLYAPKTFFDCRKDQFPVATTYCHCTSTTGQLAIQLVGEDRGTDRIIVQGLGKANAELDAFEFGKEPGHTVAALVKILRQRKRMFPDADAFHALISSLTGFQAKISTAIEDIKDSTGSMKKVLEKTVQSGVPESFTINVQPYLSGPQVSLLVETQVTAHSDHVTVALFAFGLDASKRECAIDVFREMTDTIAAAGIPVIHDIQF